MDELFPPETVLMDSPRLAWMRRHSLETELVLNAGIVSPETGDEGPLWVCRVKKLHPGFSCYTDKQIAGGETEMDAIAEFARKNGIPLWNEENL